MHGGATQSRRNALAMLMLQVRWRLQGASDRVLKATEGQLAAREGPVSALRHQLPHQHNAVALRKPVAANHISGKVVQCLVSFKL